MMNYLSFLQIWLFLPHVFLFISYDCDSQAHHSFLKFDATEISSCDLKDKWESRQTNISVQVLQRKYVDTVNVVKCTLTRTMKIGNLLIFYK